MDFNKEEKDRSDNQQELIERLILMGVSKEDIYEEKEDDPPEIAKLKRHLILISIDSKKLKKKKSKDKNSIKDNQKRLIKEHEADNKRFMDFDHNRDKDGKLNSLGEHSGNRSSYEKPIVESTLNKFKEKLQKNIAEIKGKLLGELEGDLSNSQLGNQQQIQYKGNESLSNLGYISPDPTPDNAEVRKIIESHKQSDKGNSL